LLKITEKIWSKQHKQGSKDSNHSIIIKATEKRGGMVMAHGMKDTDPESTCRRHWSELHISHIIDFIIQASYC
jgi:hypothetical protein